MVDPDFDFDDLNPKLESDPDEAGFGCLLWLVILVGFLVIGGFI